MNKETEDLCLEFVNNVRVQANDFIEKLGSRGDMSDNEIYTSIMLSFSQLIARLIYKSDTNDLKVQESNLFYFYLNTKDILRQINGANNFENPHKL